MAAEGLGGPARKYTLHIEIQGDSWHDVIGLLRDHIVMIQQGGEPTKSAVLSLKGGPTRSGLLQVDVNPEMTPTQYQAELTQSRRLHKESKAPQDAEN